MDLDNIFGFVRWYGEMTESNGTPKATTLG